MTYTSRPQVQSWNFYCPAKSGTILTTLEVAVLLQSWKNQTRKLGVRLLMPRYDIKTIADQMKIIFSWTSETFAQIPVVQGTLYQKILNLDYNRMNCSHHPEIGPFVLLEEKNGIKYKYRLPRRPLPIDRSLDILFDAEQQKLRENPIQQPLQFSASDRNMWHPHQNEHHGINNTYQHNQVGINAHQDPGQTSFRRTFMDNYESYSSNLETRKSGDQDRGSTSFIHAPFQNRRSTPPPHDSEIITNRLVVDLVDEDDEMPNANLSDLSTDEPSMSIYTNNINRQGDNANPGFTNVVNPGSSLTGQYPERIRGGGSSDAAEPNDSTVDHQGNYLYLCDLPRNQWKGKAVYTFVQTASKGSICRDALLVGFARMCIEDDSRDEEIPDKVEIEAHYLSGTGYLKNTKIHRSDSDEVWIVNIDQDCEEARVIAKLHSQNKLPRDYQEELQRVTLQKTIPDNYQIEDKQNRQNNNLTDKQRENDHSTRSQTGTSDGQQVRGEESSTIARSCADALCLEFDRTPYLYVCEEQPLGMKSSVEYRSGCHECSLCSLPFERYLVCTVPSEHKENHSKYRFSRSLGCSLMSDTALAEQPSYSDGNIPGWLGEGKSLLLKIARLIPSSLKNATDDFREEADPLRSFRIFDNEANYATWLSFVAECTCTEMLAQALVALLASIQRTKLPDWWSRRNSGWSTPYAIMRESNLSALYLHIYVLDAALSGIISRPLEGKTNPHNKSNGANDVQNRRMKQYWERAMAQGYKAFEGNNHDKCYHCSDGGHLLCCELCPNVQHHECCDPKLNNDVKLDHWICDSCINDLDTYEVEEEFEDFQDEELSS